MKMKVSVIVPVHNAEKTLSRCVESILAQSYKNLEIILVNDGSTDKSLEICQSFVNIDNRVVVIDKKKGGVSSARNGGLKATTGDFIQFVDADDSINPNMTEKLVEAMLETNVDVVLCGYDRVSGKSANVKRPKSAVYSKASAFKDTFVEIYKLAFFNAPWNKLYRRDKIKGLFDENISMGEDLLFNLAYFSNCNKISVISDNLYNYNVASQVSLAAKFDDSLLLTQIMLNKKVQEFFENKFECKDFRAINEVFAKEIYYYLKKLVILSGCDRRVALEKIKACLNNEDVKKTLNNVTLTDTQVAIICKLMRLKCGFAIYLFFKLKSFINKNGLR